MADLDKGESSDYAEIDDGGEPHWSLTESIRIRPPPPPKWKPPDPPKETSEYPTHEDVALRIDWRSRLRLPRRYADEYSLGELQDYPYPSHETGEDSDPTSAKKVKGERQGAVRSASEEFAAAGQPDPPVKGGQEQRSDEKPQPPPYPAGGAPSQRGPPTLPSNYFSSSSAAPSLVLSDPAAVRDLLSPGRLTWHQHNEAMDRLKDESAEAIRQADERNKLALAIVKLEKDFAVRLAVLEERLRSEEAMHEQAQAEVQRLQKLNERLLHRTWPGGDESSSGECASVAAGGSDAEWSGGSSVQGPSASAVHLDLRLATMGLVGRGPEEFHRLAAPASLPDDVAARKLNAASADAPPSTLTTSSDSDSQVFRF